MKIFNWVNRRSRHHSNVHPCSVFPQQDDEFEQKKEESETKALLRHDALLDAIDGILRIGTFGLDPFEQFNQHNECITGSTEHESGEEEEVKRSKALMVFNDDDEDLKMAFMCSDGELDEDDEISLMKNPVIGDPVSPEGWWRQTTAEKRTTLAELFLADSNETKKDTEKKGCGGSVTAEQRTTLADLLWVDSVAMENNKNDLDKAVVAIPGNKTTGFQRKHNAGVSFFVKKLMQGGNLRAKLYRKKLNKKIHAELDMNVDGALSNMGCREIDRVSLLQCPS